MTTNNQSDSGTDSRIPKLKTVWMEKPQSSRLDPIRFNSLLKSKNSPILLRAIAVPNRELKSKTPFILLAALALCLAIACYMLATSSGINLGHNKEFPRLTMPRASEGGHMPCDGYSVEILSWKSTGCWTSPGMGEIHPKDLQSHLDKLAAQYRELQRHPQIIVRVAHEQPAKHFIHLTQCMEKAGIADLHISVFRPDAYDL